MHINTYTHAELHEHDIYSTLWEHLYSLSITSSQVRQGFKKLKVTRGTGPVWTRRTSLDYIQSHEMMFQAKHYLTSFIQSVSFALHNPLCNSISDSLVMFPTNKILVYCGHIFTLVEWKIHLYSIATQHCPHLDANTENLNNRTFWRISSGKSHCTVSTLRSFRTMSTPCRLQILRIK